MFLLRSNGRISKPAAHHSSFARWWAANGRLLREHPVVGHSLASLADSKCHPQRQPGLIEALARTRWGHVGRTLCSFSSCDWPAQEASPEWCSPPPSLPHTGTCHSTPSWWTWPLPAQAPWCSDCQMDADPWCSKKAAGASSKSGLRANTAGKQQYMCIM